LDIKEGGYSSRGSDEAEFEGVHPLLAQLALVPDKG
jgi:hypothetical protein